MEIVERANSQPGVCALSHDSNGPFVDTKASLNCERVGINPHMYIHVPIAEEIGRTVGMIPERVLESANHEVEELRERVRELEQELNDSNLALEAVETLKNKGFEQGRKPGRPRKPRHESEVPV